MVNSCRGVHWECLPVLVIWEWDWHHAHIVSEQAHPAGGGVWLIAGGRVAAEGDSVCAVAEVAATLKL